MPYLDLYTTPLSQGMAAHLLRRATFGPTQSEISSFTGMMANDAINLLISNANYNVPEPVDLDSTKSTKGLPFMSTNHYNEERNFWYIIYIKKWWIGLITQTSPVSILDKLTLFWQNHFVTSSVVVDEYRFIYQYFMLLRNNSLGNFKFLVKEITKTPAMLKFQNGNENVKGRPNENYARELQELFTVGEKDFYGNKNYSEIDVKEAAKALTGWKYIFEPENFGSRFEPTDHDESNKTFSQYYNNRIITGQTGQGAGNIELDNLVDMLLEHPHTPKFICRKLYRWFVNPVVTEDVENNIIIPLATLFSSPTNNYAIEPVIKKLLSSEHFFEQANVGSMIKSPFEFIMGTLKFFNFPPPPVTINDVDSFWKYSEFISSLLNQLQMEPLNQPSVFGYEPYYQTGYSKVWVNSTTLALRSWYTDTFMWIGLMVNENYSLRFDFFSILSTVTNPRDPYSVVERFTLNLFATELSITQKNFLTDTIMMMGLPRTSWRFEYEAYLRYEPDGTNGIKYKMIVLMTYLLRMAEFQIF